MALVSPYGRSVVAVGSLVLLPVTAVLAWFYWPAALITGVLWLFLMYFFRDPERVIPPGEELFVSPADGKVTDIGPIDHVPELGGPGVRIGIFLSVFNVHVNRAPSAGKVLSVVYRPGKFGNALRGQQASAENEANTVVLGHVGTGNPIAVIRQIAGLIARRIVCTAGVGTEFVRGERIGMIRFGSRTELILPASLKPEVQVREGQSVRGGADVLAVVHLPQGWQEADPDLEKAENWECVEPGDSRGLARTGGVERAKAGAEPAVPDPGEDA